MDKETPATAKKSKVAIRVMMSRSDYKELKRIAAMERTNVSNLIRRAVARHFFIKY